MRVENEANGMYVYKSKLGRIIGIFLQIPTFSHGNNAAMCVALLRVAVMYAVFLRFDCDESKQPYSILSIAPFVQKKNFGCHMTNVYRVLAERNSYILLFTHRMK